MGVASGLSKQPRCHVEAAAGEENHSVSFVLEEQRASVAGTAASKSGQIDRHPRRSDPRRYRTVSLLVMRSRATASRAERGTGCLQPITWRRLGHPACASCETVAGQELLSGTVPTCDKPEAARTPPGAARKRNAGAAAGAARGRRPTGGGAFRGRGDGRTRTRRAGGGGGRYN